MSRPYIVQLVAGALLLAIALTFGSIIDAGASRPIMPGDGGRGICRVSHAINGRTIKQTHC